MAGAGLARASIVLAALVKKLRRFIAAQTEREDCRIPSQIYSSRRSKDGLLAFSPEVVQYFPVRLSGSHP